LAQAGIDAGVFERMEEALDMLLEAEGLAVEGPRHVEDAVAIDPGSVAEGDHDLAFGNDLSVEPRDAFVSECHHRPLFARTRAADDILAAARLACHHPFGLSPSERDSPCLTSE